MGNRMQYQGDYSRRSLVRKMTEEEYMKLEELKKRLGEEKSKLKIEAESKDIHAQLDSIQRRKDHPKLAAFSDSVKNLVCGLKKTGGKVGKAAGKAADTLNRMDERTAAQQKAGKAKAKTGAKAKGEDKVKEIKKGMEDAMNIIP